MRSHLLLVALLLLLSPTHCQMNENEFVLRRMIQVPDFCKDYYHSSAAKWRPGSLEQEISENALKGDGGPWHLTEEYKEQRKMVLKNAEKNYSRHFCNAEKFVPIVLSSTVDLNCLEICHQCVPGSFPLCFIRNPFYAGLAQVCLCTYDIEHPFSNAAFSIRHEKRIFSRRIRARYE